MCTFWVHLPGSLGNDTRNFNAGNNNMFIYILKRLKKIYERWKVCGRKKGSCFVVFFLNDDLDQFPGMVCIRILHVRVHRPCTYEHEEDDSHMLKKN